MRVLDLHDLSLAATAVAIVTARAGNGRYINTSAPLWSNAADLAPVEGPVGDGWVSGRRCEPYIERLGVHADVPDDVPPLADLRREGRRPSDSTGVFTVIDVGWTVRELTASPNAWLSQMTPDLDVVVGSYTQLGLRLLETALVELASLVPGGSKRWPTVVLLAGGPRSVHGGLLSAGPTEEPCDGRRLVRRLPLTSSWAEAAMEGRRTPASVERLGHWIVDLATAETSTSVTPDDIGRACAADRPSRPRPLGARR
ncbi:hypothetical protein RDV89_17515 [Nocardioides zeae]|uniref:Uncharacterized protein n=1 Tax=Nocardioides imazamoxiresistens TaxID=3231893 RepID=A0ABU3Q192_9ACTN|nr:hypothetical protein [Nocardioides zeae]MDT9594891.1 hypothetical protein [Nocardioides zeae]